MTTMNTAVMMIQSSLICRETEIYERHKKPPFLVFSYAEIFYYVNIFSFVDLVQICMP
jgi:hypothetical protein